MREHRAISPPAWGWPGQVEIQSGPYMDFPTRVGMARRVKMDTLHQMRFPHPRGDGPRTRSMLDDPAKISPPAWGWPGSSADFDPIRRDFPTRVGMARPAAGGRPAAAGFPHPRGDGPD